jgi:hypothetical protein
MATKKGLKDDKNKPMVDLVTPECILAMGDVLTFGAKKYAPNTWQNVSSDKHYAAMMRHIMKWRKAKINGESALDPETGLNHIWHAMTNCMFLIHHEEKQNGI